MSKHTQGPWCLSPTGRYVRYAGVHGANICDLEVFGGPEEEGRANARLIAAAPALLEALRGLLTCSLPHDVSGQRFVAAAVEAIRQATGEA